MTYAGLADEREGDTNIIGGGVNAYRVSSMRDQFFTPSGGGAGTTQYVNDVYAAKSQQGRNVVAGPYVYSLVFGMTVNDVSGKAIANLATDDLSHPNPVFHGDTLFVESEVLEVRPSESKPDRGVVRVHTRAYNQDGTLVAEFKRAVLVPRKNPG
jgi:acyl dehydratase